MLKSFKFFVLPNSFDLEFDLKVITSFSHEIENLEDKSIENLKEIIDFGVKQFSRDRFRVRLKFYFKIKLLQHTVNLLILAHYRNRTISVTNLFLTLK